MVILFYQTPLDVSVTFINLCRRLRHKFSLGIIGFVALFILYGLVLTTTKEETEKTTIEAINYDIQVTNEDVSSPVLVGTIDLNSY